MSFLCTSDFTSFVGKHLVSRNSKVISALTKPAFKLMNNLRGAQR